MKHQKNYYEAHSVITLIAHIWPTKQVEQAETSREDSRTSLSLSRLVPFELIKEFKSG